MSNGFKKILLGLCCLTLVALLLFNVAKQAPKKALRAAQTYQIYFNDTIGPAQEYITIGRFIDAAKPGDVVYLHVAGYGGRINGLVYLMNKIERCKGKVVAIVDGDIMSAHAALALAADEIQLPKYGVVLFHASSSTHMAAVDCLSEMGKLDRGRNAYIQCINISHAMTKVYNKVVMKAYSKALSKKEIDNLLDGATITIGMDELRERLK